MGNFVTTQSLTATEAAMAEIYRKKKARKTIVRWASFFAAIILLLWGLSPLGHFAINGVKSIKGTIFFVVKGQTPMHGDIAAFYPPKGNLYPDEMWFGKYVAGMAGDEVSVDGRDFYINGHFIGHAKPFSSSGIPLEMSSPGVIPGGYYFMWTDHEDSYDSRYADIDLIHQKNVFGRMYRIDWLVLGVVLIGFLLLLAKVLKKKVFTRKK
jgi:conjugal transfer pilin signal peptidase TrbI